ncbi:MAG: TIGR03960 family B12-binding radical SAM protein [Phycisphaerales bacterium]|nr:MAG: TIGR03960 family B12-binding radical SAM protein [Phycisphaerales bacterium]
MENRKTEILAERIDREFLPLVRRPARYIGGEVNQIRKDLEKCDLTVALCFPDVYEVGMSNTGLALIYHVLNQKSNVAAERVFAPWTDAEAILRKRHIPLFSLESKASLASFDVIAFGLSNELCYTNVLNMLDLAGLAVRRSERNAADPLIIAGGGMANCCEPVADFIDLFVLGEAEEAVVELADLLVAGKTQGQSKSDILLTAAQRFEWAYVPQFYEFEYKDGPIAALKAKHEALRTRFSNAVVTDFENAPVPTAPIVPFAEAVHERVSIEIMRGCPGRCRFCQASFCRRPIRVRSAKRVFELAQAAHKSTGFDTVSLLSLSSADYPHLEELVSRLQGYFEGKRVGLSVPSLRVDQQLHLLPKYFSSVRKSGLTIAVEAASERLRRIVNKPLKDDDLFAAVEAAYRFGWQKLKLYFMVGLPGETLDDVTGIVDLAEQLARLRRPVDGKVAMLNVAVSWFVPKPHTPLGWFPQRPRAYFEQARELIIAEKLKRRAKFLRFKFHDIRRSLLESAIGRADRRGGRIIEAAWRSGARFDLWDECFDYDTWQAAFATSNLDLQAAAQKEFAPEAILPWEHLGGPEKAYLLKHFNEVTGHLQRQQQRPLGS